MNGAIESIYHEEGRLHYINGSPRMEYFQRDHLGNTRLVYTDLNGDGRIDTPTEILQESHFYTYGMPKKGPWMEALNNPMAYQFNGIEKVDNFGLGVNMAVYRTLDPELGMWWQIDPAAEVLAPMSPYCAMGNNPILNADPKGDYAISAIAIGAGIGLLTNGISNRNNDRPFFENLGQAATFGGMSGALSLGIGQAFGAVGSLANEVGRATAHGLVGGGLSHIQGGNFGNGFLSGAFSSGIGSGIDGIGGNAASQIVGGGLSGGFSSVISGGSFWSGLGQGLAIGGLNHAVHSLFNNKGGPPWEYKGKKYHSESDLYMAILADYAADQFGITDIVALAAAIDNVGLLSKPFSAKGASKGTSFASKYGSKLLPQKMPRRLPTHIRNGSIRYTKILGRFLGRMAGPVGWGILTYDIGMTFYKTQTTYNNIIYGG